MARLGRTGGTPDYRDLLACEFPHDPRAEAKGVSRRSALKLMAASAALGGLDGLHQAAHGENRPLRAAAAGGFCPRQTPLLCHRHAHGGIRHRLAGGKPHGPAHKGGRKSQPPRQPGRRQCVRAGFRADAFTIRTAPRWWFTAAALGTGARSSPRWTKIAPSSSSERVRGCAF